MAGGGQIVETRTIEMVSESERHGVPFNQFTLWFSANLQITAVVDGALSIVFGAEALTAIIGLLIGNILGGIVMALHSAQGPRLGLPQMISSRAQFGVKGATLPLILVVIMYLGFAATGTVLSGQAINLMFGVSHPAFGIVAFGLLTAVVAIVGYRLIHTVRIASIVSIVGFGYLAIRLFSLYDISQAFGQKPFSVASLLLTVALGAGWQLTFAPYVADYSRYLPSNTKNSSTFLNTLLGSVIGAQLAMTFGVLVAALGATFLKNQVGFMGELAGPALAVVVYLAIVGGKLTVNCLNAYGGFMTMLTTVSSFSNQRSVSQAARIVYILLFIFVSMAIALWASADFLSSFKNFVLLLLAVFVPWSAINLVDYYLISKERVDIPALYDPNGRYGAYNWVALGCYVLGILVQIPFLNQALYQGPISKMLDDADISWIVGLAVTSVVYYALARNTQSVPAETIKPAAASEA
jgi:NCS1 family nucleobase:cation symporter-1